MRWVALGLAVLVAVGLQFRPDASTDPIPVPSEVPEEVRLAAEEGRYWRAARLLASYLETAADTTPETVLFAARMDAGWSEWDGVIDRLEGRSWLDDVAGGAGWDLLGRAHMATGDAAAGAAAFERYLDLARLDRESEGVAEIRRGLALAARVDGPDDSDRDTLRLALRAFDRAAARLPWFGDWIETFAARAAASGGDVLEVERRLAATEIDLDAWRLRVRAALVAGDTMAAREAALGATRAGSRADRSAAWAELGRLRVAAGDTARGKAALLRAVDSRGTRGAVDAARYLSELDPRPDEWRQIARVYQWHGNPSRAIEGYEAFLSSDEGAAGDRVQARLDLGRARFDAGRFRQAEAGLLELADDDVSDRVAAEALYTAARSQYRQGRAGAGQATFDRLAERHPGQEAVTRGLYLVADLKHDDLRTDGPDGARAYYRRAADAVPALNEAGLALMRLAGLAYLEGDYDEAAGVWEEYRSTHPNGRRAAQATYWSARAYERLGRDSLADARLREVRTAEPLSLYGVRAARALGEEVLAFPMAESPGPDTSAASIAAWEAVATETAAGLRRVDLLADLDRRDDLVHEVERLRRRAQGRDGMEGRAAEYLLAEGLNARGYTLTAIGMGWTRFEEEGGWNPRLLRIVYPYPFRSIVAAEAEANDLDPFLVAGLIRRESAFNPVVVSGAGAIGLMQIVPETGRQLARGVGIRDFDTELLTRPEVNVVLGTRFLAGLFDRYGSDLPLVLSAYNAGPTRANVWRQLPEADDPELFTERVPYGETRDYIRNVLVHEAVYRELYPEAGPVAPGS